METVLAIQLIQGTVISRSILLPTPATHLFAGATAVGGCLTCVEV